MPNLSQESPASSKALNQELKNMGVFALSKSRQVAKFLKMVGLKYMDVLCTFKFKKEKPNSS